MQDFRGVAVQDAVFRGKGSRDFGEDIVIHSDFAVGEEKIILVLHFHLSFDLHGALEIMNGVALALVVLFHIIAPFSFACGEDLFGFPELLAFLREMLDGAIASFVDHMNFFVGLFFPCKERETCI